MRIIVNTVASTTTTTSTFLFDSTKEENLQYTVNREKFIVSYTGGKTVFPMNNVLCFSVEGTEQECKRE